MENGQNPVETNPPDPVAVEAQFFEKVQKLASNAAIEASKAVADNIMAQLPELVDRMIIQRLDQQNAANAERPPSDNGSQPAPAMQVRQEQPAAGGGANVLSSLLPLVMQFMAKQDKPPDPLEKLAATLNGLGNVFEAMDKIRGSTSQQIPANTALGWTKLGYEMAKEGKPPPGYDISKVKVPPSETV